jgi:hypothetical protein
MEVPCRYISAYMSYMGTRVTLLFKVLDDDMSNPLANSGDLLSDGRGRVNS